MRLFFPRLDHVLCYFWQQNPKRLLLYISRYGACWILRQQLLIERNLVDPALNNKNYRKINNKNFEIITNATDRKKALFRCRYHRKPNFCLSTCTLKNMKDIQAKWLRKPMHNKPLLIQNKWMLEQHHLSQDSFHFIVQTLVPLVSCCCPMSCKPVV